MEFEFELRKNGKTMNLLDKNRSVDKTTKVELSKMLGNHIMKYGKIPSHIYPQNIKTPENLMYLIHMEAIQSTTVEG